MFFTGCPAHLGCTVILRGGSQQELRKVKNVVRFMVFVLYNWKFEKSYLLQERALVSTHLIDSFRTFDTNDDGEEDVPSNVVKNRLSSLEVNELSDSIDDVTHSSADNDLVGTLDIAKAHLASDAIAIPTSPTRVGKIVSDFSDPLRSEILLGSSPRAPSVMVVDNIASNAVEDNIFRKALNDVVVCVSPYMKKSMPYLETEAGKVSPLRHFFPQTLFYSEHLEAETEGGRGKHKSYRIAISNLVTIEPSGLAEENVMVQEAHPYITRAHMDCMDETARMIALADFRACGGQLKFSNHRDEKFDPNWSMKPWTWDYKARKQSSKPTSAKVEPKGKSYLYYLNITYFCSCNNSA